MATKRTTRARKPSPKPRPAAAHHHGAAHATGGAKRDRHGNPADLSAYVARLDEPGRAKWQKPGRVIAALELKKGDVAAEIGSGTGTFTIPMAKRVGAEGRVYAIDVEPRLLDLLAERAAAAKAWGIVGLLAPAGDGVPPEAVDAILLVNVLHHVHARARYLKALGARLAPGWRLVIVDFHDKETPVGPPRDHRLSREHALAAVDKGGLRLLREETFLPYQYFLVAGR